MKLAQYHYERRLQEEPNGFLSRLVSNQNNDFNQALFKRTRGES